MKHFSFCFGIVPPKKKVKMIWVLSKISRREEDEIVDGCEVMYGNEQGDKSAPSGGH